MKKLALTYLGCLAALGGACSSEPKSKKESGRLPTPYSVTAPSITELATNPEGGAILGKKPNEVAVSPTIDPNAPIFRAIDLAAGKIAGVSLDNSVQEIIDALGDHRVVENEENKTTFYIFDKQGIFVGLGKDSPKDLNAKPTFLYTATWLGYKGSINAPASLGKINIGKKVLNGRVSNGVEREQLARTLGAYIAGVPTDQAYDCFFEGSCTVAPQADGSTLLAFPRAAIAISSEGVIESLELSQEKREIKKGPAPTQRLQYGRTVAGLSLASSAKEMAATLGAAETASGVSLYRDKTVAVLRDGKGHVSRLTVNANYDGYLFAGNGQGAEIQFGEAVEGAFNCENLLAKSIKAFDPTAPAALVKCKASDKDVTVEMPGANLIFAQAQLPTATDQTTLLAGFELKFRPVVYGESIGGLKLGQKLEELGALYGQPDVLEQTPAGLYKLGFADGLTALFDEPNDKVVSIEASSRYTAPVVDSTLQTSVASLGGQNPLLTFNNQQASDASFKALALVLEGGYLKAKQGEAAGGSDTRTTFDPEQQCSFAPIRTPSCYFESKNIEGSSTFSVVLPRLRLEFDGANTLTRVSM